MTKEGEKIICDSLQGDSTLFSMDFTSHKLSWVKGICQTLETSCNEYVDACNKYIDTAGEHIRKIYEEVCDWETPDDVKGPSSGFYSKHDTISKVSNETSGVLVNNSSSKKLSACDQKQPPISITEDSHLVSLSCVSQAQIHEIASDQDNEEPHSTGAIYCSDDSKENCKETKDTFPLADDPTSSLRQDCIQLLKSHRDGRSLTISGHVPAVQVNGTSQDTMVPCRNDCETPIGPYEFGSPGPFLEYDIAGVSDVRKDFTSSSNNVLIQNSQTEEFEAITVEDSRDDAIENEIALISHCAEKNKSFKKKLKNVFISRKGHNLANYQYVRNITEMQNKQSSIASSTQDFIESEWELL